MRAVAACLDLQVIRVARQTYFTYLHVDDAVRALPMALETDISGHETLFLNAPDTNTETPTPDLLAECYPDSERRIDLSGYDALVTTVKARTVLDWEPERSWREYQ